MAHKKSFGLPLAIFLLASPGVFGPVAAVAQIYHPTGIDLSAGVPLSRLDGDWRTSDAVAIPASRPPINLDAVYQGSAPAAMRLERMLLLLASSVAQRQALTTELENQQNPASPEYRHWLTPAAFADAYGNSAADIAAVTAWLQSQGFQVAPLPAGRGWIEFSGTVTQVEQAFHTQIDSAITVGGTRAVLAQGISVPAALMPLVQGLVSLDGAFSTPALTAPQPVAVSAAELAAETSPNHLEALTPQLAAQLLHLDALHEASVDGTGESIAIAARSNVNSQDIAAFRAAFGRRGDPATPPTVVPNGPDPGLTGDQAEATLAASWAGAAAPGAQIVLVPAATTSATDGLDLSLAAIVDQALAHTVAVGYSACEAALSQAHQAFYSALYRQAAAEGIAVIAAAGDSGPSACHLAGSDAPVSGGYGVNALASTPWNTAVGVAAFGPAGTAAGISALSAWSPASATEPAYAGGGGGSSLYAAPGWQPIPAEVSQGTAGTGIHNRLLPDLALPTAVDTSVNPGLAFCLSGSTTTAGASSGCTLARSGGSSAATAIFAGVAALVAEKYGAQGNLAPHLYALSRQSGIFEDVQQGSAQLKCFAGSPGCGASEQIGFTAGAGYDLATGLGVPDVQKLVTSLATPAATATYTFTLSISPVQANNTYNPSALVTFTVNVVGSAGIPTGTANLYDATNYNVLTPNFTLTSSGSATIGPMELSNLYNYSGFESYRLGAHYSGDSTYSEEDSGYLLSVSSEVSPTVLTITPSTISPALGSNITVTITLGIVASGPPAGSVSPTGAVTLTVNGVALNPVSLTTTGSVTSAVFTVPITAASNSIVASYPGDSNYGGTTTNPYILTASKAATTVVLTASTTTVQPGMAVTLTATVTPIVTPAAGLEQNPSGTVLFYDGTTLIGSATLNSGPGANSSTAVLTVQTLPNGADSLTVFYEGDSTYGTSTSSALTVDVAKAAATVVLSSNFNPVPPGAAVILTATVTPVTPPLAGAEQNPSGNVIFYNGTTVIGEAALVPVPLSDSSTATLTTQTLPGGYDSLSAVYLGDSFYDTATSNILTLAVENFTITPSPSNPPTNLDIVQGAAGSASFIVTGLGGFNGEIQVVCAVPPQDDMTCTATPQQVVPTATVTFVIQTFISGGPTTASIPSRSREPIWPRAAGGTALAVLGFFLLPFGRRARIFTRRSTRRFLVLLMLLVVLCGAGIGCNSVSGIPVTSTGTPLGVATLKITGSAYVDNTVVSQSVYLTVNVLAPPSAAH
ncbi:MAG: Ig-like domain repeat protein [Terracidiphilus sp.]|jgi:hypothetical protein